MKTRPFARQVRLLRNFRQRCGVFGLGLLMLGQTTHVAEARNLIVTQSGGTASGGIAATTGNPTGASTGTVAGGLTPAQAQARAAQQVADMTRAAHLIITQQQVQSAAALITTPVITSGLTTLGTSNPGLTPDSGLTLHHKGVSNPSLTPGTTTTYDVPTSWTGISGLSQTTTGTTSHGKTTVDIDQETTSSTAVLNWNTFNVSSNTTVQFEQSAPGSIVFNKIAANIAPSQIFGSIQAPGQVYIINANGIIFGGTAQVNVHNLTASALPINDTLIQQGLLNNPNLLNLFSALAKDLPSASQSQIPTSGKIGDVVVEKGAVLSAPTNADNVGGRIALIGANVSNEGTILTPDGQAVLAAGLEVGILPSSDASVRGLNFYVGAITDPSISGTAGSVVNAGIISAPRGNITLVGAAINQNGVLSATTSVAENGSIDLQAIYNDTPVTSVTTPYFEYGQTGSVTFAANSLTEILPEYDSTATIAGQVVGSNPIAQTVLALPSQIEVQGQTISLLGDMPGSGAEILAPNADLTLAAGVPNLLGVDTLDYTAGAVNVGSGAIIDVAGSANVAASVADNIISVELLGAELADAPLQRDGPLKGQTIKIDLGQTGTNADGTTWIGTPLADTLGYVNEVQYTVGELTTAGGKVTINSGGAVNLAQGSVVNVAGGYVNYAGAEVQTTRVETATGQILDISQAGPNTAYTGIYTGSFTTTDPHLGLSNTFTNPEQTGAYYEPGYVKGGNGGSIAIQAPAMTLNGQFSGRTVVGPRQLTGSRVPVASSLSLNVAKIANNAPVYTPGLNIFIQNADSPAPVAPAGFVNDGQGNTLASLILSPDLVGPDGFSNFTIKNSEGSITVAPEANLISQPDGAITWDASKITVDANIIDPGGNLNFTVRQVSAFNPVVNNVPVQPVIDPDKGLFTLGSGDTLSTAGLVVDYRASAVPLTTPAINQGGKITIKSYSADLSGGILNVSGGLVVSPNSTESFSGSAAGQIDLEVGQDPNVALYRSVLGGTLDLTGTVFEGYSGLTGGSLTIQAPAVQVGGGQPAQTATLWLQPSFFDQGGFSTFALKGLGLLGQQEVPAVLIAPGTQIDPLVENWQAGFDASGNPSLSATLLPVGLRNPVSLSFTAEGVNDSFASTPTALIRGDLVMGAGASIGTPGEPLTPLSSVTLAGDTVDMLGTIAAPAGTITLSGVTDQTALQAGGLTVAETVHLGSSSVLSAIGTVQQGFDKFGNLIGPVLGGGKISLTGDIVADGADANGPGAVLDVSGASGVLTLPPYDSGAAYAADIVTQQPAAFIPTRVDSNGGTIAIANGPLSLVMNATLSGFAGGTTAAGGTSTAQGGSLILSSQRQSNQPLPSDIDLIITPVETTSVQPGVSQFAATDFNGHGFSALTLSGNVEFSGGTTTLDAASSLIIGTGGVITIDSGSTAMLEAPYVMLGQAFQSPAAIAPTNVFVSNGGPFFIAPKSGTGVLQVTSTDLIDLGNLSLQNVGTASLTSTNDIRGDGTLDLAGTLNLQAGQIYGPTASAFSIVDYDPSGGTGAVNISTSGSLRALPYSAGSTLTILASTITQDGVLRAPFGTINLGWNGTGSSPLAIDPLSGASGSQLPTTSLLTLGATSVTSVSAVDPSTGQALTLPYGVTLNGSWIDPKGIDITLTGPPAKAVNISADSVTDTTGATVDVQGGGDLYAYEFVPGTGGSSDFLAPTTSTQTQTSFAVIPGYQPDYAPYGAYDTSSSVAANFQTTVNDGGNGSTATATDLGYVDATLKVGDQIYLGGGGLAAGVYTLLPARYALLPGAFLVTPAGKGGTVNEANLPEENGSSLVSGYRYNSLDAARFGQPLEAAFTVSPETLVRATAQYDDSFANAFFAEAAAAHSLVTPRLPEDSGQLVLDATTSLQLDPGAAVISAPLNNAGLGGLVDIATSKDIFVYGTAQSGDIITGDLNLSVDELNSFGAASLLLGGIRQTTTSGTSVAVTTGNIEVDNAGDPLVGPEIILVTAPSTSTSASNLVLDAGAEIKQQGTLAGSAGEILLVGNAANPGSGNGNILWVTSNPSAQVERSGVSAQTPAPTLSLLAGATISAVSPVLDSTGQTLIDPTAVIQGQNTTLGGSQVTLWLSGDEPTAGGLILTASQLASLSSGGNLSLSSQSSIDVYGTGTVGSLTTLGNLTLDAASIRGFDSQGGTLTGGDNVTFAAQSITLNNLAGGTAPAAVSGIVANGTLTFAAKVIQLGGNTLQVDQFANVTLQASTNLLIQGAGPSAAPGTLSTPGNLTIVTPLITAVQTPPPTLASISTVTPAASTLSPSQTISAGGTLILEAPSGGPTTTTTAGLGASLALSAASITDDTNIQLPSGTVSLEATTGDVQIGAKGAAVIDAGGAAQSFNDLTEYTAGGQVELTADKGNVSVATGSTISVSANAGGGNAGSIIVQAAQGTFTNAGTFQGKGGAVVNGTAGQAGSAMLDVGSFGSGDSSFNVLSASLGEFTQSLDVRVRSGNIDVTGDLKSHDVVLSADTGSITVAGGATIDASYDTDSKFSATTSTGTGGSIALSASGDVTILGTLTVEGQTFDDAGKGGAVTLESGTSQVVAGTVVPGSGKVDLAAGSTINLKVDSATATSTAQGDFTGTLTLIAPQVDANGQPILANNPQGAVPTGVAIAGIDGTIIDPSSVVIVGNRIYQPADGTIDSEEAPILADGQAFAGTTGTTSAADTAVLNLLAHQSAAVRAVAIIEPGAEIVNPTGSLTLGSTTSTTDSDWNLATYRFGPKSAPGLLTIRAQGNLDLFNAISDGFQPSSQTVLRDDPLLAASALLPANSQSWSYRLVAGADFAAADYEQVLSTAALLAINPTNNPVKTGPAGSLQLGKSSAGGTIDPSTIDPTYYQVIRTGSGSIDIATGGSIQLLNPFATIYTAGTQAPALKNFLVPTDVEIDQDEQDAQYSFAGGNVTLAAQDNIEHVTQNSLHQSIDAQEQLPINWLGRRGNTDSALATTSWWVDFSNFVEGIGALGGGNVSLTSGNSITNVDAVIPTNARLPEGPANLANLVELGGGDLLVHSGNAIDGGVYYVERGQGTLDAGTSITTNAARQPVTSIGTLSAPLPVTLFLGNGSFNVTAGGAIDLAQAANPFLLPTSANDPSISAYFSTYGANDAVNVASLNGTITLTAATSATATGATGLISPLDEWLSVVDLDTTQPWLLVNQGNSDQIGNYQLATLLLPPTLRTTAFSGDVDVIGNLSLGGGVAAGSLTLSPSPTGNLEIAAEGSINALQPLIGSTTWTSAGITLSDADPASLPSLLAPLTISDPSVNGLDNLLEDTGSTGGNLQSRQALHTPGGLHAGDPNPVRLYAETGDISGLEVIAGKQARIIAGNDISDIAFYLQNLQTSDISIVAAGRDIIAYDPNSPLQSQADAPDNQLADVVQAGDIQVGGPGTLEVLAGRNLTFGDGPDNGDGTGLGLTSIGNQRNPYLPSSPGADLVAGAGIGVAAVGGNDGLADSLINFTDPVAHTGFIDQFLNPAYAGTESSVYLPVLGAALGLSSGTSDQDIWTAFLAKSPQEQAVLALNLFYRVLSDSGIAHNDPASATYGSYLVGKEAIAALFPGSAWHGDITMSSREIKTENGGGINLFAPGGNLTLGVDITKPSADQGILTAEGGAINIYTSNDVNLGASRIFTLRGGDVTVWSAEGNIAAGASSKTVSAAPPTRVIVDPQTGDVETDLAGLATGGGIGVLQSRASTVTSNVNLIAPIGTVDAGDAGIRVSGNLNIAALHIVNAANISVGGSSSGVPTAAGANVSGLLGASNVAGAANQAAEKLANLGSSSDISVQVIGYGGD